MFYRGNYKTKLMINNISNRFSNPKIKLARQNKMMNNHSRVELIQSRVKIELVSVKSRLLG